MNQPTIQAGDTVRIVAGAHGGRIGKVRGFGNEAVHVEFQAPVMLTRPDGPTKSITLPFSRRELVVATDLIPATLGRHRRVSVPVPVDFDHGTKARHLPTHDSELDARCPACRPDDYARDHAKHRAVSA